jgi:hypothetical protein
MRQSGQDATRCALGEMCESEFAISGVAGDERANEDLAASPLSRCNYLEGHSIA